MASTGASFAGAGQLAALGCNPISQRLGLIDLYNSTNGPGWSNSSGWPSISGLASMSASSLAQYMAAIPMQSGSCTTPGSNTTVVLPDHCCWYGIACCGPQTCGNDPYCNCTSGLVTELQLYSNQVCACMYALPSTRIQSFPIQNASCG